MTTNDTAEIGAKELTIGLHVIMKEATNWTRFQDHRLSDDRRSITVELEDGREFKIAVYEAEKPFNNSLLEALVYWLVSNPNLSYPDIHDALVSYVDYWRNS